MYFYQPLRKIADNNGELLPNELTSFQVFISRTVCAKWLEDHGHDERLFNIVRYDEDEIENPTIILFNGTDYFMEEYVKPKISADRDYIMRLISQLRDTRDKLVPAIKQYLVGLLKNNDGEIDLSGWDDSVCVTYDGGRHPEYNSNPFSVVFRIFLGKNDSIFLEIEDCDEYGIDRLSYNEIIDVYEFVDEVTRNSDYDE